MSKFNIGDEVRWTYEPEVTGTVVVIDRDTIFVKLDNGYSGDLFSPSGRKLQAGLKSVGFAESALENRGLTLADVENYRVYLVEHLSPRSRKKLAVLGGAGEDVKLVNQDGRVSWSSREQSKNYRVIREVNDVDFDFFT